MNRKDLRLLFDKIPEEVSIEAKEKIISKLLICDKYMSISPITLITTIYEFIELEKEGYIDKIDDNLIVLILKIMGYKKNKAQSMVDIYFIDYLKYIIIPGNIIECDNDYNLPKFLGEFEIFLSYTKDHANMIDLEMINYYNHNLYSIIDFKIQKERELVTVGNSFTEQIAIDLTLSHLITIYYFSSNLYDNDISVLENIFNILLKNKDKLIKYCKDNNLYADILNMDFLSDRNVMKEYEMAKKMLDRYMEKKKKKVK